MRVTRARHTNAAKWTVIETLMSHLVTLERIQFSDQFLPDALCVSASVSPAGDPGGDQQELHGSGVAGGPEAHPAAVGWRGQADGVPLQRHADQGRGL
eukprot:4916558-Pyramimonas_sp.AAC.2